MNLLQMGLILKNKVWAIFDDFLLDSKFRDFEYTEIIKVDFGSQAHFRIFRNRPDRKSFYKVFSLCLKIA